MPALITHHLFGEESMGRLPEGIVSTDDERAAFLIANQGPDPFFFRARTPNMKACMKLGHVMHSKRISKQFSALREGVEHLPSQDVGVGRAFALGLLSHYVLDRNAHPFVYAQQWGIQEADPDLKEAGSEVHAVIESDLDSWMLWRLRRATVHDCPPAGELARTERIDRVAGALTSLVAWAAFGIELPATEYAAAVASMEFVYRLIEPAGSTGSAVVGGLERVARPHSQLQALAHRVTSSEECAAANLERHEWKDPFTNTLSRDSFADRFDQALKGWPALAEAFTRGGNEVRAQVAGLNYSGRPLGADELCPPEWRD